MLPVSINTPNRSIINRQNSKGASLAFGCSACDEIKMLLSSEIGKKYEPTTQIRKNVAIYVDSAINFAERQTSKGISVLFAKFNAGMSHEEISTGWLKHLKQEAKLNEEGKPNSFYTLILSLAKGSFDKGTINFVKK